MQASARDSAGQKKEQKFSLPDDLTDNVVRPSERNLYILLHVLGQGANFIYTVIKIGGWDGFEMFFGISMQGHAE